MHSGSGEDWVTWTIRSFLLSCIICFIAAFWITLAWWGLWLVALVGLTACLTPVFAVTAMLAPLVVMLQGRKKPLTVGAKITVTWSDEPRTIILSPDDWQRVKAGLPVTIRCDGYIYREQWFGEIWRFNSPNDKLVVDYEYSEDDMGTGFTGTLASAHILESNTRGPG